MMEMLGEEERLAPLTPGYTQRRSWSKTPPPAPDNEPAAYIHTYLVQYSYMPGMAEPQTGGTSTRYV